MSECASRVKLFELYGAECSKLVETGAYKGDGIAAALKAGFEHVVSFEISDEWVRHCRKRFSEGTLHSDFGKHVEVRIVPVSSDSESFKAYVESLTEPTLFWLDAHKMNEPKSKHNYPLKSELSAVLEAIVGNGVKHVILMDDVRRFERYGTSVDEVSAKIHEACPDYSVCLDSCRAGYPSDVLCAFSK